MIGAKRATILNPNTMKTKKKRHNEKRKVKDVDEKHKKMEKGRPTAVGKA
jgi:hypothetical protein